MRGKIVKPVDWHYATKKTATRRQRPSSSEEVERVGGPMQRR